MTLYVLLAHTAAFGTTVLAVAGAIAYSRRNAQ